MTFLRWKKNESLRVVVQVAAAFFVLCLLLTLHRYYSFYATYDQGIFNQLFWNGTRGHLFESSLSSALSTNVVHQNQLPSVSYYRLGQHFTPALMLWLPIYSLFPSPVTLTVLQVTLITAAGLVLYALARHHLEPRLSATIVVSYYAANAVIGPTLGNFHDSCQTPLYVFGLLLAMEKRWWPLFGILATLMLAVREDGGVVLFGVGAYMILSRRYPLTGLAVCILSFGYMIALTNLIMPLFSADISERFMMERFGQYADGDEASTLEIIWGMVSNPGRLVTELFTPFFGKIRYLLGQWLPLALVPAVAPASWTIAGFPLLKLFLAKGESVLAINIRYAMTVVPGLFYGAILWWAGRQKEEDRIKRGEQTILRFPNAVLPFPSSSQFRRFWGFCICLSLFFTFTSNPNRTFSFILPDAIDPWVQVPLIRQWQHVSQVRPLLAQIPDNASVAATNTIVPILSSRREILRFPMFELRNDAGEAVKMEYVIADMWQLQQYQPAFRRERGQLQQIVPAIDRMSKSGDYGIVGFEDGAILMRQGAASNSASVAAWDRFRRELEPILKQS
ncbi:MULTISPECIES: DUF2079 domain-containing protein [unclassified Microcoleus]|uniref:DUF2079 domain-containing protein n=1 Tax=unclassified Microcoleus TaxID=2642155 RepID=UPI001DE679F1|nr:MULTISPECIES: DUF2079 domain-containing protein [unclassified Microcoleus]MCC3466801.1 DUF2079 domain-containing protein [Microcoleus sp. PH2017_06_SFM_O_A]MCC3411836.1 DUF2079 domain-containing protein [Microcoleus sp. PH2017_02_FOX_O_A]MCC3473127.1 DUF2079 domain-containing protein [Microcoleus sp. PH2017_13_LAR_U_A]MCC3485513.1 DUF2079 domain-containing protein [Microcoleus sp. PH2017_14_LAR_D_A]MCC3517538.1 DUF2079 domain-containing protein [Microcoleus sp. PH2017_18_LLB_O_A]